MGEPFIPNESYRYLFPWEKVLSCFDNPLNACHFHHHRSCPQCDALPGDLFWLSFHTPKSSWQDVSGRQGPLSICYHCKIQVEFVFKRFN